MATEHRRSKARNVFKFIEITHVLSVLASKAYLKDLTSEIEWLGLASIPVCTVGVLSNGTSHKVMPP